MKPALDLADFIYATLRARKGKHGRDFSRFDAINIAARARAKAGHMNNRERLITAIKYEVLAWEAAA